VLVVVGFPRVPRPGGRACGAGPGGSDIAIFPGRPPPFPSPIDIGSNTEGRDGREIGGPGSETGGGGAGGDIEGTGRDVGREAGGSGRELGGIEIETRGIERETGGSIAWFEVGTGTGTEVTCEVGADAVFETGADVWADTAG
jgi:hypothetical protein